METMRVFSWFSASPRSARNASTLETHVLFQDLLRRRRHEEVIGVPDQDDALVHPLLRRGLDGIAVTVLAAEEPLHPVEGDIRQHGREDSALRRARLAGAPVALCRSSRP